MKSFEYPNALIVQFAKAPVPGEVKTRLIPWLGANGACELHRTMVSHVFTSLLAEHLAPVELHANMPEHPFMQQLGVSGSVEVCEQIEGDLGAKMAAVFDKALQRPSTHAVVLVGSDCPSIDAAYLRDAFKALEQGNDLVIGPASDGGYVLIGMSKCTKLIFDDVAWGGSGVLKTTLKKAQQASLKTVLLSERHDIDRAEDLPLLAPCGIAEPHRH